MSKESAQIEKLKAVITAYYTDEGLTLNRQYMDKQTRILEFAKEAPKREVEISIQPKPNNYWIIIIEN